MIFNDGKAQTARQGQNQLSHLHKRVNFHDRHQHDQRQKRAGAAETEVENESEVRHLPTYLTNATEDGESQGKPEPTAITCQVS